jgi:CheY-like chemotaxis protein/anti-sigma regulatory factor (Ser/Thr protein kinase)
MRRQVRYRGTLTTSQAPTPLVLANEGRLTQVLVNTLTNALHALDALPDERPRHVEVRVAPQDGRVLIQVIDNGVGVPAHVLPHVFDPFFTTRPSGMGLGIGLALCKRMVGEWGGTIALESREGEGTSVSVRLPVQTPEQLRPYRGARPRPKHADVAAGARVLVVDDDLSVLRSIERSLRGRCLVDAVASGERALELLRMRAYDAVLCDLQMPHPDGAAIHRAIVEEAPHLGPRTAFITGGGMTRAAMAFADAAERTGLPLLRKPFDGDVLWQIVEQLLARA